MNKIQIEHEILEFEALIKQLIDTINDPETDSAIRADLQAFVEFNISQIKSLKSKKALLDRGMGM